MQINRTGAVIMLDRDLRPDQQILIKRQAPSESHRQSQVRIVGQFGRQKDGFVYGVEILQPENDVWAIEFPPIAESQEAVARMLLECTYCRAREVVYLNELELRGFRDKPRNRPSLQDVQRSQHLDASATRRRKETCFARGARTRRSQRTSAGPADQRRGAPEDAHEDAAHRVHPAGRTRTTNWPSARIFRRSACVSAASAVTKPKRAD